MWEWNETAYDGTNDAVGENQERRGGSWFFNSNNLDASKRSILHPMDEVYNTGFRVAAVGVPEPSTGLLVVLGLSGLLLKRRKTGTL